MQRKGERELVRCIAGFYMALALSVCLVAQVPAAGTGANASNNPRDQFSFTNESLINFLNDRGEAIAAYEPANEH